MLIGKPAKPMSAERQGILSRVAFFSEDVVEAHIPMCFIPGHMTTSQEVLVAVLKEGCEEAMVMRNLSARLATVLPPGQEMLSFSLSLDSDLVDLVRATGCRLAPPWSS